MNRKFEDKLVELAFEDLEPAEATRLEQEARHDPEAAEALYAYRELREGLRSLGEVPEDQLSKERLRDAILGRGLQPTPPRRNWVWAPAAACAMLAAAFLLLVRPGEAPTSEPMFVADFKPNLTLDDPGSFFRADYDFGPEEAPVVAVEAEGAESPAPSATIERAPAEAATPRTPSAPRPPSNSRVASAPRAEIPSAAPSPPRSEPRGTSEGGRRSAGLVASYTPASESASQGSYENSIVVIAAERDASTGAQRAIEVDASYVVFGG
jgi:hypothetical protein